MSDENGAPAGGEAIATSTTATNEPMTVREAHEAYSARKETESKAPVADTPVVETNELADKANAAPEKVTGEAPEAIDPPAVEPIEPPRSWSKEARDTWTKLDPATQQYLLDRDSKDSAAIRKAQNEAADERKALSAERQRAEQVRTDYEAKLPAIMQALQDIQAGSFSDVKTMDDVTRLASEDPFRYLQWQAHQQKMQAVNHEMQESQTRQTQEQQTKWADHVNKENTLFAELVPEFADKAKAQQMTTAAVEVLHDKGFTDQELANLASGKDKLSIYDHRVQLLLLDGVKYRDVQKAKSVAIPKPVPQVQRPGVAQPKGAATDANVQALSSRLTNTGSVKDAFALYQAKKKAV